MATYEVELEDGTKYQVETEEAKPTSSTPEEPTDIFINGPGNVPEKYQPGNIPEKTGGYGERFYNEISDPTKLASTVMNIPSSIWGAMKEAYGAVRDTPQNFKNIVDHPDVAFQPQNVEKALGAVGSTAARGNPFFYLTGPAYDKALQFADPNTFPETSPEEDASKVRGELVNGLATMRLGEAADMGAGGIKKAGNFLEDKLATKNIPEQVIPEVKADYMDWKPPPTFDEIYSGAKRAQALKSGQVIDPNTGEISSNLDNIIERNKDLLEANPQDSLQGVISNKEKALGDASGLVSQAESQRVPLQPTQQTVTRVIPGAEEDPIPHPFGSGPRPGKTPDQIINETVTIPPQYEIQAPNAQSFISSIRDPIDRAKAAEYLAEKKAAFESQWDGNLNTLHKYRQELTSSNSKAYGKGLGDVVVDQSEIDKALARDLNDMIEKNANGYQAANSRASEMLKLEPLAKQRLGKAQAVQAANEAGPVKSDVVQPEQTIPAQSVPGPWQSRVDSAARILAPAFGYMKGGGVYGALAGSGANEMLRTVGGAGNLLGKTAGVAGDIAGGLQKAATSPFAQAMNSPALGPVASMEQQSTLLPRDSDQLMHNLDGYMAEFLMRATPTPQAPIAQGLVDKMRKAMHAQDMDTVEKLHSDMTRLFPDFFEPGLGVNGKLFYPDEQAKYMDNLKQLNRMGQVDTITLAKQQNAFNNPQDSRVLPVKPIPSPAPTTPQPRFYEGTRVFGY